MALTVGVFLLLFGAGLWAFTRMGHRFAMVERGVGLVKKKRRIAFSVFFFNDTATTEIYTLSLHDALPIFNAVSSLTMLEVQVHLFSLGDNLVSYVRVLWTMGLGEVRCSLG